MLAVGIAVNELRGGGATGRHRLSAGFADLLHVLRELRDLRD
jgi:hypothetical protein